MFSMLFQFSSMFSVLFLYFFYPIQRHFQFRDLVSKIVENWGGGKDEIVSQPFPKQQILNSSKLKEIADDNFKFDENGGKFSKRIVNSVGNGEIAC